LWFARILPLKVFHYWLTGPDSNDIFFLPVSDPKRRKEINLWNAARKKISPGVTAVMNPVQERESAASASNTI
jgi:hypothetical protein